MSRVLPDAIVSRVQKQLGIADSEHLRQELPKMIEDGLQRLYDFQHVDGGIGWWKHDASNPNMTAYILFGLNEVKKAGFAVDEGMMRRGITFVQEWLDDTTVDTRPTRAYSHIATGANVRAYALYVLAELGEGDLGKSVNLYERREKLDLYGKAYLALALYLLNGNESNARVETLLDELRTAAVVADGQATGRSQQSLVHWEERAVDYWMMNNDVRTTAIVLDALVRIAPGDPLIGPAVRWLMAARRNGHWGSTQATAASLIALVDYLLSSGELEADYAYRILVDGDEVAGRVVDEGNLAVPGRVVVPLADLSTAETHHIKVIREARPGQTGQGMLYASLSYRHYPPADQVPSLERGFRVRREYTLAGGTHPVSRARLGDVVQVELTVHLDDAVNFMVVEDPLPAGLEPIDTSLAITGQSYGGDNADWRWSHVELRDEKVALFAAYLKPGTYTYTYLARATTSGLFRVLPGEAYPMYAPEIYGRGEGSLFVVEE
jgi:uncharacterized protein YfaS (alpha-2-macroglobulin family)